MWYDGKQTRISGLYAYYGFVYGFFRAKYIHYIYPMANMSWSRKHFGLSHSVLCVLLSNYSQKTPMWQLAPRLASWAQLFASVHVCVCVKGAKVSSTKPRLRFISYNVKGLSCVCVCVCMLHPVVQVSAIIVHWLSSKLRMFPATHSRVSESVSQSVSKSFNQSFRQTVEGYELTNRILTHSHNGFLSVSCKYKKNWLGQSLCFRDQRYKMIHFIYSI